MSRCYDPEAPAAVTGNQRMYRLELRLRQWPAQLAIVLKAALAGAYGDLDEDGSLRGEEPAPFVGCILAGTGRALTWGEMVRAWLVTGLGRAIWTKEAELEDRTRLRAANVAIGVLIACGLGVLAAAAYSLIFGGGPWLLLLAIAAVIAGVALLPAWRPPWLDRWWGMLVGDDR